MGKLGCSCAHVTNEQLPSFWRLLTSVLVNSNGEFSSRTFSFELSRNEYCSLYRRGNLATNRLRVIMFVLITVSVVGLILQTHGEKKFGGVLFAYGCTFFIFIVVLSVVLTPGLSWRRDPSLASTRQVTIDSQGITVTTSDLTARLDWQRLSTAVETEKGFQFVFRSPPTVVLLPKSSLGSTQDLEFVRDFLPRKYIR